MRLLRAAFLPAPVLLALSGPLGAHAIELPAQPIEIESQPIENFRFASSETRFGALEFVGGLVLSSDNRDFGDLSSFRFLSPGGRFIGVADTGFWFFGAIERDEDGRPTGIADFAMQPMYGPDGQITDDKWYVDAEALDIRGDRATVGFERHHRILEFLLEPGQMGPPIGEVDVLIPIQVLDDNKSFETVAYSPEEGPLAGARVTVTERGLDEHGDLLSAILEGPEKGIFTVARHDDFDVTDGVFLSNGDLLLLERRFSLLSGLAMRLRRIEADTIRPGSVADGPVLMEANMLHRIDNMEGLDVWRREDGAKMVSLISDDNHFFLQRTLYLEFRLVEE